MRVAWLNDDVRLGMSLNGILEIQTRIKALKTLPSLMNAECLGPGTSKLERYPQASCSKKNIGYKPIVRKVALDGVHNLCVVAVDVLPWITSAVRLEGLEPPTF